MQRVEITCEMTWMMSTSECVESVGKIQTDMKILEEYCLRRRKIIENVSGEDREVSEQSEDLRGRVMFPSNIQEQLFL